MVNGQDWIRDGFLQESRGLPRLDLRCLGKFYLFLRSRLPSRHSHASPIQYLPFHVAVRYPHPLQFPLCLYTSCPCPATSLSLSPSKLGIRLSLPPTSHQSYLTFILLLILILDRTSLMLFCLLSNFFTLFFNSGFKWTLLTFLLRSQNLARSVRRGD